ncbi:MAG: ClC family H(+)/Cl(-) exchange transporter [Lactobacillus sp.]|nr:ClC family H(+)/Cl(-) exchange transporter [Lactobacillus sp.]
MKAIRTYFNFEKLTYIWRGCLIGLAAGAVTAGFRYLIGQAVTFVQALFQTVRQGQLLLLIPIGLGLIIIGLIVGLLLRQQPAISGSGIPQVEALIEDELSYNWWSILWRKFVGGVLAIGPGLGLGREGPSIQLGAAAGQGLARAYRAQGADRRIMIAAGAAGGLSAAFNAPMAGTMFVLEEIYHTFSYPVWLTSLASAVAANFVALYVFGLQPVLHLNYQASLPISQYWQLAILGIVLGLLGRVYQVCLLNQGKFFRYFKKLPRSFHGLIPLLAVIPLGLWHPEWLGGGNGIILSFNTPQLSIGILVLLFIVRFIFSMLSYGSGLPGGIFLPILSLGAIIGALYGAVMVHLGLLAPIYWYNLVIFAMAGYFAAIGKAPFTAVLLITEMVGSLQHLMPLAFLCLIAYVSNDMLNGQPIYTSLKNRLRVAQLVGNGQLDEIQVPVLEIPGASAFQVRQLAWPPESLLISIQRGESRVIPHGNTVIRPGDILIVLVPNGQVGHYKALITTQLSQLYEKIARDTTSNDT